MLIRVARESAGLNSWTDEDAAFASQFYTDEQQEFYRSLKTSPDGQARIRDAWEDLIEDIEKASQTELTAQQEASLVNRWRKAMAVFTGHEPALEKATDAWMEAGYADPKYKNRMPFSENMWRFMKALIAKN